MKKVWIGLGIGCGALVLLGIVGVVAGGMFLKHKAESFSGAMTKSADAMKAQQKRVAELNEKYPFKEPPAGEPLALTDDRMQAYLAVREGALPVYKDFETKSKALGDQYKNAGRARGIQGGLEAMGMLQDFITKTREVYLSGLDQQHMSPKEFSSITGAIYASALAGSGERRKQLESALADMQKRAESATGQAKQILDQQVAMMKQTIASMPVPSNGAVVDANAALVAKYKSRIDTAANPAFDAFTIGDTGEGWSKQWDAAAGHADTAGSHAE